MRCNESNSIRKKMSRYVTEREQLKFIRMNDVCIMEQKYLVMIGIVWACVCVKFYSFVIQVLSYIGSRMHNEGEESSLWFGLSQKKMPTPRDNMC